MGQIQYSEKYFDDTFEYRHVVLPPEVAKLLPKNRLLSESEWRAIGVQQSRGWVHYAIHRPEPHIMLFRRPLNFQQQQENQSYHFQYSWPLPVPHPDTSSQSPPSLRKEEETEYGVDDESGEEVNDSKFPWRDYWYRVSSLEDLDPLLPTPFQLLVRDLVLCLIKLIKNGLLLMINEGRIDENGHLQCSYRGWSFDGCGWCAQIPQAMPEGPEAHAVNSPRAYATRSPTMVSQDNKPEFSTVITQHDLLYCYDTLLENVSDPSLIVFSHHKVTGRRDIAKPLPFKVESSGSWDFAGTNDGNPRISAEFVAPCYYMNKVEIDTKLPIVGAQKWIIWICSFDVPMAPGKIHSTVCSARNFFQFTMPGYMVTNFKLLKLGYPAPRKKKVNVSHAYVQEQHSVLEQFQEMCCEILKKKKEKKTYIVVPRWHEHWTSNKVYNGDMIFLQGKRRYFFHNPWEVLLLTFTHTQADRFVLAFHIWLSYYHLPLKTKSSRYFHIVLDRFEQHTQKCSSCKRACEFQTLQKFLIGATVAFLH
ncbi:LOW QUALITY PROTEIN: hypothetical protein NC652_022524 [Populus alba x Populus x berolinensis]|nr:LOW QUALITY PROTEIN: hypothetical protein NC652_022524 [Populus alba x Populus x berolinensis]